MHKKILIKEVHASQEGYSLMDKAYILNDNLMIHVFVLYWKREALAGPSALL